MQYEEDKRISGKVYHYVWGIRIDNDMRVHENAAKLYRLRRSNACYALLTRNRSCATRSEQPMVVWTALAVTRRGFPTAHCILMISALLVGCAPATNNAQPRGGNPPSKAGTDRQGGGVNLVGGPRLRKAQDFIEADMYEQAIALLDEEIQAEPKNAPAHLLLGQCQLATGRVGDAEQSFRRVTVLDSDLGFQIGSVVVAAAKAKLREEQYADAIGLMALAEKYDPKKAEQTAELSLDAAKSLFNARRYKDAFVFLNNAVAKDQTTKPTAAQALYAVLQSQLGKTTDPDGELDKVAQACVELQPSLRNKTANLYLELGRSILRSDEMRLDAALTKGITKAVRLDPNLAPLAGEFLFSAAMQSRNHAISVKAASAACELHKALSPKARAFLLEVAEKSYRQGQIEEFKDAFGAAETLSRSTTQPIMDRELCLKALFAYFSSNRVDAIKVLRTLKNSDDEFAKSTADAILGPPGTGRHAVGKAVEWKDLGWTGPMRIEITHFDVTQDHKIVLHFTAVNRAPKLNKLMFGFRGEEEWFPYIVDDNGKKLFPLITFQEGNQEAGNEDGQCRNIILNKGESVNLSLTFPMTSEGASQFDFVSPKLNGWQWEWSMKNISLK